MNGKSVAQEPGKRAGETVLHVRSCCKQNYAGGAQLWRAYHPWLSLLDQLRTTQEVQNLGSDTKVVFTNVERGLDGSFPHVNFKGQ